MKEPAILSAFKDPKSPLVEVMNTLFDGVYVVDTERRILFWNKGAEEITGYPAAEVLGRRCADNILNHIDEDGNLLCTGACPLLASIRTGKNGQMKVYPLTRSGKRKPVVTHVAPLKDESGEVVAGIEIFRDFSAEEDYRILQEKFNALVKKYVSGATMDSIRNQLEGPAGSSCIRDLTVAYLDVVGFTTFTERHAPEETVRMLNDVFGICEVITRRFHGDIDKFIGDAVMATFIDANDAVGAGRIILEALDRMNRQRSEEGREPVRVRIGMNSGNVIQGSIGTADRKDLTVIGDVVNTAARIQTLADPDTLYISEATFARLKDPSGFAFRKETPVKGRAQPVRVFAWSGP